VEDLLFVLGLVAFFGLCVAYIRFCDGVIGPEGTETVEAASDRRSEASAR
jgi:hypothetical protein